MAQKLVLSLGTGETSDYLNLLDDAKHYVRRDGVSAPPPVTGARRRSIQLALIVKGSTTDNMWANYRAIEQKLQQARDAVRRRAGIGVTLGFQINTTGWVYFDVTDGVLALDRIWPNGTTLTAVLSLVCLPYGRGDRVTETVTSTLTNGTGSTWLVSSVKGDLPSPARVLISDVSTNSLVINGVHVFSRSMVGLSSGDYDPCVELTAASPGSAETDSSSYSGSNYAELEANENWRTIAEVARPSGAANDGEVDVWLRARNDSAVPSAPLDLAATVSDSAITVREAGTSAAPDGTSATTTTVTVSDDIAAGETLILSFRHGGAVTTINSITAVGGGTWTLGDDGVDNAAVASTTFVSIYWLRAVTSIASGTVITVTTALSRDYRGIRLLAATGLAASPVEQVGADSGPTTTTNFAINSVTTTQAYQLLVAAATNAQTPPTSYKTVGSWTRHGNGSVVGLWYRLVTSASTYGITVTTGGMVSHLGTLASFKGASPVPASLTTGTWNLRVVAVGPGGELSPVSNLQQVVVANATDAIALTWNAPASGTVDTYRVYRDRGSGWGYFDTGNDDTFYTWTTESGITAGTPNPDGDSDVGLLRVQAALASGTVVQTGDPVALTLTSVWEDVQADTHTLPPRRANLGAAPPNWLLRVQAKGSTTMDVDVVWLPHRAEPQLFAGYPGTLSTKRDWLLEQLPDGGLSTQLYQTGTTTDAGQVEALGQLTVGPGATQMAIRMIGVGGVSDVTDLKCTVILSYVPLYRYLPGSG